MNKTNQKIKKDLRKFLIPLYIGIKITAAAIAPCSFSLTRNALPLAALLFLKILQVSYLRMS